MKAFWVMYPGVSEGMATIRVLIPDRTEKLRSNSVSSIREGGLTSIGNRSCSHRQVEWDVVPLALSYQVENYSNPNRYNFCYKTTGLPQEHWTSLLNTFPERTVRVHSFQGKYDREDRLAVLTVEAGRCVVATRTTVTYRQTSQKVYDYASYVTYVFDLQANNRCKVTIHSIREGFAAHDTTADYTVGSYPIHVDYSPVVVDLNSFWATHGGELQWRARTHLPLQDFGTLSRQCMVSGDKAYQTNSAMYLIELGQLASLLSPYLELMKGGLSAKKAANAWLSYYYGARLTVKDTYAQVSGIVRQSHRRIMDYSVVRARDQGSIQTSDGTIISGYNALSCYYHSHCNWIVNTYRALRRYGLNPSLSLAWDLIPLSFVVDWLIPIGDYLQYFDSQTFSDSLNVIESLLTTKYTVTTSASSLGYRGTGNFTITWYKRRVTPRTVPKPTFSFDNPSFSGIKVLNGTSLIVQRLP